MCKCNKGPRELRATQYIVVPGAFVIVASPSCCCCGPVTRLCNGEDFKLITCLPFPQVLTLSPVFVFIGGALFPVLDCNGNVLVSDQIRCRRCYTMSFGSLLGHFILRKELCPSQATPSCVTLPLPLVTAVAQDNIEAAVSKAVTDLKATAVEVGAGISADVGTVDGSGAPKVDVKGVK